MNTPTRARDTHEQDRILDQKSEMTRGALPRSGPYAAFVASATLVATALAVTEFSVSLFAVGSAVLFGLTMHLWSRLAEGPRKSRDRTVTIIVTSAFMLALFPLISVLITVISRGAARMDAQFFSYSMQGVVGEGGGAYHALIGTLVITAVATLISVPIGLLSAIYLVEYGQGRLAKAVTFFVDVMTGIPSIVAGLFAYTLFTMLFGPGTVNGFAGAVALSVLMVPVVVRSSEEMLKIVSSDLREAAYALGTPKWRVILKVVLPTAAAGIATGVTLAIARVIGETAPLLIATGITTATKFSPFDGQMASLSVFSYYQYATPGVPPGPSIDRAWAAALMLILIVMALNLVARLISRLFAPKTHS